MDTISNYLKQDHARCDALFQRVLDGIVARDWAQALTGYERFSAALARHIAMEETVVFRWFEQAIGSSNGPTQSMRMEHRQLRGVVQRLGEAIALAAVGDCATHADTLRITQAQHAIKEEGILYPLVDRMLCGHQAELIAAMSAFDSNAASCQALRDGQAHTASLPA